VDVTAASPEFAAFSAAARYALGVVARPEIGAAWDQPSALARMTVGDVAGHVFLVLRRVDKHLDEARVQPVAGGVPLRRGWAYPRVDTEADLDLAVHTAVRHDGHHVAAWGWADVVAACRARIATLERRLPDEAPSHVMLGPLAVPFGGYLGSRVVELLVHADDLAVSVGLDLTPPPDAVAVAVACLVDAARAVHGDTAVLRAFTRRERVPPGAPAVY
jgi:uncharacterized protein (TIGR03083 family)